MEYHSGGSLPLLGRPRYCPGANANGGYLCETGHCCGETGCCTYYYELWWFWLLWTVLILFSCCCAYRHRRAKLRVQQQQRQREISLLAYHGASSFPSSMLDLSFLASLKLPSYEEVAAQPSTPPPPYSSVFTTPRYPQPPRAADPHLLSQHSPLLHRPLSDGPSSLSSDNSSSCSCDSCCPSSPCSSSLSAPITYETDTSHASTPSEATPLTLDVTMETMAAAACCLEADEAGLSSEGATGAQEPNAKESSLPSPTVTTATSSQHPSPPGSELTLPGPTTSAVNLQLEATSPSPAVGAGSRTSPGLDARKSPSTKILRTESVSGPPSPADNPSENCTTIKPPGTLRSPRTPDPVRVPCSPSSVPPPDVHRTLAFRTSKTSLQSPDQSLSLEPLLSPITPTRAPEPKSLTRDQEPLVSDPYQAPGPGLPNLSPAPAPKPTYLNLIPVPGAAPVSSPLTQNQNLEQLLGSGPVQTPRSPASGSVQTPHSPGSGLVQTPHSPGSGLDQTPHCPGSGPVQTPHCPGSGLVQIPHSPGSGLVQTPHSPGSGLVQTPQSPGSGLVQTPHSPGSGPVQIPHSPGSGPVQRSGSVVSRLDSTSSADGSGPALVPDGSRPALVPGGSGPALVPDGSGPALVPDGSRPALVPDGSGPALVPDGSGPALVPDEPSESNLLPPLPSDVQTGFSSGSGPQSSPLSPLALVPTCLEPEAPPPSCPAITIESEAPPYPSSLRSPPPLSAPALLLDPLTAKGGSSSGHASSLSPSPRATQSPPKQTVFSPCVDVFEPGPPCWEDGGEEQDHRDEEEDEDDDVAADESQYRHRRLTGDSGIEVCRCRVEEEDDEEEEEEEEDRRRGGGNSGVHDSVDCPARGQMSPGGELSLCTPTATVATPTPDDSSKVIIVMETV